MVVFEKKKKTMGGENNGKGSPSGKWMGKERKKKQQPYSWQVDDVKITRDENEI